MTLQNLITGKKALLRLAALGVASLSLSGCVYDMGMGYADYGNNYYDCDPYSAWDSYYNCDNGYGFSNIGYGGGWFDNYYYPGYGLFIFDSYGARYNMRDNHRHYWSNQRYGWQRERGGQGRGRGHGGGQGYNDQGRNHYQNQANQPIGWPERHGGRTDEGRARGERSGNYGRNNTEGSEGVVPPQQPRPDRVRSDRPQNADPARGEGMRGYGRGGRGGGNRGVGYTEAPQNAAPVAQPAAPVYERQAREAQAPSQPRYFPQNQPRPERSNENEQRSERPARAERRARIEQSDRVE